MKRLNSKLASVCVVILLIGTTQVALGVSNDDIRNAEPTGEGTHILYDTRGATHDGPGGCNNGPNVWFCYTASCTGDVTVAIQGAYYDTVMAVYDGCSSDITSSDRIGCNDDYGDSWLSQVTFAATAGKQYLIEIGAYQDYTGDGYLVISCAGQPGPANNDACANAQAVGNATDLAFDTTKATHDGPGLCMTGPNIWYVYTASCTGEATVSLLGSEYDTMLAVYEGDDCDLTSNDLIACNDDYPPERQSQITFETIAGRAYLIEVGGYGTATGQGVLNISCEPAGQPSKDDCAHAQAVGEVKDLSFDTTDASFDGPALCMTSPNIWFLYTASCTGDATVSLLGSSYDTMLAVYDGYSCNLTSSDMIACNDDFPPGYTSQITFSAIAGGQYLIEVGGYGSNTGEGVLNISCESGGGGTTDMSDLGDAPDSTNNFGKNMNAYPAPAAVKANYPTVFDDGTGTGPFGPIHMNEELVAFLGKNITREIEADSGPDQDGVNNIDPSSGESNDDKGDDGVTMPLDLPAGHWTTFEYTVNVVDPGVDLWVNVWFDWNRDGDWDDTLDGAQGPAPEWAVQNQFLFDLPAGSNVITTPAFIPWHPQGGREQIWMRITLSEQPFKGGSDPQAKGHGGSGPEDGYVYGETEDYYFTPDMTYTVCQDFNGDGVINTDDLVDFTAVWLDNCPD
jgi:hypothetical protein